MARYPKDSCTLDHFEESVPIIPWSWLSVEDGERNGRISTSKIKANGGLSLFNHRHGCFAVFSRTTRVLVNLAAEVNVAADRYPTRRGVAD